MAYIPDNIDLQLLDLIQNDARLTNAELGKIVELSPSGVQKRLRKLEENRVIQRYVTVVNRRQLDYDLLVFVKVIIKGHSTDLIAEFDNAVQDIPEILESHRIIGDADYLLKVVVRDRDHFDQFLMDRLLALKSVDRVSSYVVLKEVKETSAIKLRHSV